MSKLNSKTRGGTDCRKNGNARPNRLLHQFETCAATHEKNLISDWEGSRKPLGTDDLVHRIVPPDILPHEAKITSAIKQRRRMQSARLPKNLLGAAELRRHLMDCPGADAEPVFASQHSKSHASDSFK